MSDGPHVSRAAPGKRISIALAVAVHILLAVFLIYGIRWQTKATDVVEVDLVPAPAAPAPEKVAPPAVAEPPPPRPEPRIEPRPAPPPKADIAIKEKPKPPKEEPKRPSFLDSLNREFEQLTTRKADAEAARDKAAQEAAQKSAAQDKMRVAWYDRIKAKIKSNIILPPGITGNPEATYEVTLMPDGSVLSVRQRKSSGVAAVDAAIERAINKSSPLPKPDDPAVFQRALPPLVFRPMED